MGITKRILSKFFGKKEIQSQGYDFDKNNPLGDGGERVDFIFKDNLEYENLDLYQKNHYKRYEFADKVISENSACGDFACGTGYGSVLLSGKNRQMTGIDINCKVISEIQKRYSDNKKVSFLCQDLLTIDYQDSFDNIISFETIEHFEENNIQKLLALYNQALKDNGNLMFSVPYMQEKSENAIKLGFHLTFYINEEKIEKWLSEAGFEIENIWYQNYQTHIIEKSLENKEFIICKARKIKNA